MYVYYSISVLINKILHTKYLYLMFVNLYITVYLFKLVYLYSNIYMYLLNKEITNCLKRIQHTAQWAFDLNSTGLVPSFR